MFYFVSIMLTLGMLILSIFQMSLPTVYSILKKDFYRTVNENGWTTGIKFADMQLRMDNWTPPTIDPFNPPDWSQGAYVGRIDASGNEIPEYTLVSKFEITRVGADFFIEVDNVYKP